MLVYTIAFDNTLQDRAAKLYDEALACLKHQNDEESCRHFPL